MTSEEAVIVAEPRDPYKTDNPLHLEYHKLNKSRGRMAGQIRIRIRYGKTISEWIGSCWFRRKRWDRCLREQAGWFGGS